MKKIVSKIISGFLTAFIVICVGVSAIAIFSKKNNHGVARIFDYSIMHVLTDSMEPEYKVGTGLVVKKVDIKTLEVGDDIAFAKTNGTREIVVMHRITEIDSVNWEITTMGINPNSTQCDGDGKVCIPDVGITEDRIIGKVISNSAFLGFILRTLQSRTTIFILILIPIGILVFYSARNLIKTIKNKDGDENDDETLKIEESGGGVK